jgi:hypothetical protein
MESRTLLKLVDQTILNIVEMKLYEFRAMLEKLDEALMDRYADYSDMEQYLGRLLPRVKLTIHTR